MNEATSDYIWINDELNNFNQIIPRRYTLVHDPNISDLFLCINHEFMYQHLISSEFKLLQDNINIKNLDSISDEMLKEYLVFSNYYATYSTTKKGAIASYANLEEIQEYIKNR